MKDHSPIKIICRVINLITYTLTIFLIYLISAIVVNAEILHLAALFQSPAIAIICATPLLIMMIISLILKYTIEEGYRVNPYRIIETITKIIATVPISLTACYYIFTYFPHNDIINTIIGVIAFFIIDRIIIFTLQETLSVTFIIHDHL